ncbi:MAG: hypothetical protein KDK08_17390 [Rhizobiaceae bacterium]|nr:hypothetical protein [Rhizobiaceae bacterium]
MSGDIGTMLCRDSTKDDVSGLMITIPEYKFDPIKYLVARKYPHARASFSYRIKFLPEPATAGVLGNVIADAFEQELLAKSEEEIAALVKAEQAAEQQELIEIESGQWFNSPKSKADFDYWTRMESWTLEEGVLLTMGKEPRVVTWDRVKSDDSYSPFVRTFRQRLDFAERAKTWSTLNERRNVPGLFLLWAKRIDLSYPEELEIVITREYGTPANWRAKYEAEVAEHTRTRQELDGLKSVQEKTQPKPGWQRERESLIKIVIGMAVKGYSYNLESARNSAVKEIADDMHSLGIGLDEDTVRKYVSEGRALLPGMKTEQDDP